MADQMPDVERLLRRFIEDFEADRSTRPQAYLEQVAGTDRRELEALIDAYLERAPRRSFDAAAYAQSPARHLVDDLTESLEGVAGTWPVLLPRLRHSARLKRSELVARLAAALGVPGREAKVESYYHAMEQGLLEPAGVSDRVLDALASLTGTTRDALRAAARGFAPRPGEAGARAAFARTAMPDPDFMETKSAAPAAPRRSDEPWDEVDELFRGVRRPDDAPTS
ncbi:MAG TPA: hypothetical protein VGJ32_05955 [Solirubrobacteraceae bacterium]